MSAPLTGSIKATANGKFQAGVPRVRGSHKRTTATFGLRAEAQRWVDACIVALRAGRALPDPCDFRSDRSRRSAVVTGTRFIRVAEDWIRENYVEDGNGDIDREEQVRRYATVIDEYLEKQGLYVEDATREHARAMYRAFKAAPTTPDVVLPDDLDPEKLVTAREARALLAEHGWTSSESSFKRARAAGWLKPADARGRTHLYRLGDVFDPASGLAPSRDTTRPQYAHSTLRDVRRVFRAVMELAKIQGISLQPGVRKADLPKDKTRKVKTRSLVLEEMGRIAGRLHVVHQLVLFLLRLLGLRISEAYGLRVEDVVDLGPGRPGLLTVQSQGGRRFKNRAADGRVEISNHRDETKCDSWRMLVVPTSLMDVIRIIIECFHIDADGAWRGEARLIPGLKREDVGGQSAFRTALKLAAAREGIDLELDQGRRRPQPAGARGRVQVTPQAMRQSFATALQADREVVENIRAAMGHRRGSEVIHLNYFIEDSELKPQRDVARTLQRQVEASLPDGLMVPTTTRCTTGNQPALAKRAAEIDSYLLDLGWQVEQAPGGEWITVAQAAEIRGVTSTQIRDDIADGKLTATTTPRGTNDSYSYLVDAGEVIVMTERVGHGGSAMGQLADELDVPYDRVRQYVRRNLDLDQRTGRDHRLTEEQADAIRAYFLEQRALAERAVPLPQVCKELGLSAASVDTLIKHGRLVEDIRMHGGIRSITKHSLADYHRRPRRPRHGTKLG